MKTHSALSDLQCRRKHRKSRGEGIIIRLSIFTSFQFSINENLGPGGHPPLATSLIYGRRANARVADSQVSRAIKSAA